MFRNVSLESHLQFEEFTIKVGKFAEMFPLLSVHKILDIKINDWKLILSPCYPS